MPIAIKARDHGLRVLPVIVGCAPWADQVPNDYGGWFPGPGAIQAYADFAMMTAWHFIYNGTPLAAIEVWNEPNLHQNDNWFRYPDWNVEVTWTEHYKRARIWLEHWKARDSLRDGFARHGLPKRRFRAFGLCLTEQRHTA